MKPDPKLLTPEDRAKAWRHDRQRQGLLPVTDAERDADERDARLMEATRERKAAKLRKAVFGFNPPKKWTAAQRRRAAGEE